MEPQEPSVQLHILNFVDKKMEEVKVLFSEHEHDEIERYEKIQRELEGLTKTLSEMSNEMSMFRKEVRSAFPKNDEGVPDYLGHQNDHRQRIASAEQDDEIRNFARAWMKRDEKRGEDLRVVLRSLAGVVLAGMVVWLAHEIWLGVLRGPS